MFDLAFDQPREPSEDAALAKAIAEAGHVVLFEMLTSDRQPITDAAGVVRGVLAREQLRPPLPAFAEAAAGLAPFPLPKVPNRVSQFWLFRPGAEGGPTLPVVALQLYALWFIRNGSICWSARGLRASRRPMGRSWATPQPSRTSCSACGRVSRSIRTR